MMACQWDTLQAKPSTSLYFSPRHRRYHANVIQTTSRKKLKRASTWRSTPDVICGGIFMIDPPGAVLKPFEAGYQPKSPALKPSQMKLIVFSAGKLDACKSRSATRRIRHCTASARHLCAQDSRKLTSYPVDIQTVLSLRLALENHVWLRASTSRWHRRHAEHPVEKSALNSRT